MTRCSRVKASRHVRRWTLLACTLLLLAGLMAGAPPAMARQYLWQTNASGDDIHVIDIASRTVVRRIVVGPEPHGIVAPADNSVVLVSLEANDREKGELVWIDPVTFQIQHRLEVGREPQNLAVTPDGRWAYVPCRDGTYWVVDVAKREVVTQIKTGGRPHNTTASPDSRTMFLSPMGENGRVTVVDAAKGHQASGEIQFSGSVRPAALSADGSELYQHVDGLNGFEVAETASRRMTARVEHATPLGWFKATGKLGWLNSGGFHRCHGLAARPDGVEIWSVCGPRVNIHGRVNGRYPELASIPLPDNGYWITFAPDSKYAFVAIPSRNLAVMIDTASRDVAAQFDVGKRPARNLVLALPGN